MPVITEPGSQSPRRGRQQELALLGSYLAPRRLLVLVLLLLALAGGLVIAYQFPPAQYFVDVGAPDDEPYIANFHNASLDGKDSYRTTDYYSYVSIPGSGSLPYTLSLRLDGSNPTNPAQPLTITVFVGGVPVYSGRLKGGWQELSLAVNQQTAAAAVAARDLVVELRSQTYRSPDSPAEDRGPKLDWVRVTPIADGFIAPSIGVLLRLVAFVALLYLLLARGAALLTRTPTPIPPRNGGGGKTPTPALHPYSGGSRWSLVLAAMTAAALVILMLTAHQGLALDSAHLLITVAASYLVLLATRLMLGVIHRAPTANQVNQGVMNNAPTGGQVNQGVMNHAPIRGQVNQGVMKHAPTAEPTTQNTKLNTQNLLILLIVAAFAIKFGGMDLPQTIVKDMPWHLRFINELKVGGLEQLLQPGVLSVTPRDWDLGSNALVPKSPLFYLVMLPLAYLPGELEVWVKLVICLIDVSGAVILYYLARRLLPNGERIGLLAAAVYLLTPLSYRVLSFGTLPTIFAQWLTLLAFAYLALNLSRLHHPLVLLGQSLLLALVLLSFPTMVLFTPIVLAVVFIGGALFIRDKVTRRNALLFLPLSGIIAAALAVLLYYGRYIEGVLSNTLPKIVTGVTVRGELVGDKLGGWGGLLASNISFYGSLIPFILTLAGLALLFRTAWRSPSQLGVSGGSPLQNPFQHDLQSTIYNPPSVQSLSLLLLGWLLILPLFYVANYWLDMIGKHLLYTMYPLALASGVALAHLDRMGRWGRWLVWLLLAGLAFAALDLWLGRILYGGR
jgi:hypothetical protein